MTCRDGFRVWLPTAYGFAGLGLAVGFQASSRAAFQGSISSLTPIHRPGYLMFREQSFLTLVPNCRTARPSESFEGDQILKGLSASQNFTSFLKRFEPIVLWIWSACSMSHHSVSASGSSVLFFFWGSSAVSGSFDRRVRRENSFCKAGL